MTIDDQIKDEKLQYAINREAAKISTLSSGKIDKYEYITGEEILPSHQKQMIEEAKFTKDSISEERINSEIINKLEKIEEGGKKADRSKMVYKRYNKAYNSRKAKIVRSFGNDIRTNFINMDPENAEQNHLAKYIKEFKSNAKPQADSKFLKKVKEDVLNSAMLFLNWKEMVFKAFENGIFSNLKQSKQSEESEQSSSHDKLGNDLSTSSNASHTNFSSDIDI